jgi:ribosomal protein S27E
MIKDILDDYGVYSVDLELDLLRHFETLRNEMLTVEESEKKVHSHSISLRCPNCLSKHIGQYRMMTGPIWCEFCGYRVEAKELGNPFIVKVNDQ